METVLQKDVRAKTPARDIEARERTPAANQTPERPVFKTVLAPSYAWVTDTTPAAKRRSSRR